MYVGHLKPASNRARYEVAFQVIDADTGEAIDLTDYSIVLSFRDGRGRSAILTARNDDGIDITDADEGVFTLTFTPTQMRTLCAKQYEVGCTIAPDDNEEETEQPIIGTVTVLDGVVD